MAWRMNSGHGTRVISILLDTLLEYIHRCHDLCRVVFMLHSAVGLYVVGRRPPVCPSAHHKPVKPCSVKRYSPLLPSCHWNCRDMEPDGCWTGSRDWQTDRGQQRDSIFVPAPVHCPSTGKCGLLPQHVHCHRLITHCSHYLLNFQLPTGFVLVG